MGQGLQSEGGVGRGERGERAAREHERVWEGERVRASAPQDLLRFFDVSIVTVSVPRAYSAYDTIPKMFQVPLQPFPLTERTVYRSKLTSFS